MYDKLIHQDIVMYYFSITEGEPQVIAGNKEEKKGRIKNKTKLGILFYHAVNLFTPIKNLI